MPAAQCAVARHLRLVCSREDRLSDAEIKMVAISAPAQAKKREVPRLTAQLATRLETLGWSDAEKARFAPIAADCAGKLAAAGDKSALASAKAELWKEAAGRLASPASSTSIPA
jgi:hypothetical protein